MFPLLLERVSLFDTVNVEFPALNVSATAKAVKLVYDVIADRVKSVTLGSVRANIADTISNQNQTIQDQNKEIAKKPGINAVESAIKSLTKTILGASGGSVRMLDENGDGEPDTLYIADNPNPSQAVKVWRFNYEGWGASKNGYAGPYEIGATFNDGIIADFITAGTLYGLLFKAGAIESLDGKISIDLESGSKPIFNTGIQTNNEIVVMDEKEETPLFFVKREKNSNGVEYFSLAGFDGAYNYVFRVNRLFDTSGNVTGTTLVAISDDASFTASVSGYDSSISVRGNAGRVSLGVNENWGGAYLTIPGEAPMTLSWKDNGDGTHTLIGE